MAVLTETNGHAPGGARPHILHVITGLLIGGAENMLVRMVRATRDEFRHTIVSIIDNGPLAAVARNLGADVNEIGMKRGAFPSPAKVMQLRRLIRNTKADAIQGWMYHGNAAASLFGKHAPVLWNVRHTLDDFSAETLTTRLAIKAAPHLRNQPQWIIYNARSGAETHERFGFDKALRTIIPNGFDTQYFQPDAGVRARARAALGFSDGDKVVGRLARNHPMKDHPTLFQAFRLILDQFPSAKLLLAGTGMSAESSGLAGLARQYRVYDKTLFLGERSDVRDLMLSLDVMLSTSCRSEAFPNVIGEAMACGVPLAATDVGDTAWIISDAALIAPAGEPAVLGAIAARLLSLPDEQRQQLGKVLRARIVEHFSISRVAAAYADLWRSVIQPRAIA